MNETGKRLQRQKQEDATFNKMLLWLAGIVCLELLTLLLKRVYFNFSLTDFGIGLASVISAFFGVFRFAGAVLFLAGCVWTILSLRKGKKLALPLACTGAVLWLWAAAVLCYGMNVTGMSVLTALPVALAVLCAIFFLYQHEFFFSACLGAVGIAAIWVFHKIYMNHPRLTYGGAAAVCVLMAVAALAVRFMSGKNGKVYKVQVFSPKGSYLPLYLTCAVVALAVILAVLLNAATIGYYALFVLVGWLFCLAVYYTVKLM